MIVDCGLCQGNVVICGTRVVFNIVKLHCVDLKMFIEPNSNIEQKRAVGIIV